MGLFSGESREGPDAGSPPNKFGGGTQWESLWIHEVVTRSPEAARNDCQPSAPGQTRASATHRKTAAHENRLPYTHFLSPMERGAGVKGWLREQMAPGLQA